MSRNVRSTGPAGSARVTGTVAVVPVVVPVTVSSLSPTPSPAGKVNETDAVPYSSRMSVPMVLSTGKVPSTVSPSLTVTSASLVSAAVLKARDDNENATVSPGLYSAGAPVGKCTPTERWV